MRRLALVLWLLGTGGCSAPCPPSPPSCRSDAECQELLGPTAFCSPREAPDGTWSAGCERFPSPQPGTAPLPAADMAGEGDLAPGCAGSGQACRWTSSDAGWTIGCCPGLRCVGQDVCRP